MSKGDHNYYLHAHVHNKGNTHDGGYCSDPYDMREIDTTTDEEIEVPNKEFIKKFCDNNGNVNYDGLIELSCEYRKCSGSGYCGTSVKKTVRKAKLKIDKDIKSECLAAMSSNEEEDKTNSLDNHSYIPSAPINTFRGRINTTYTSNRDWYKTGTKSKSNRSKYNAIKYRQRVRNIPCKFGDLCNRKNSVNNPCFYKHD